MKTSSLWKAVALSACIVLGTACASNDKKAESSGTPETAESVSPAENGILEEVLALIENGISEVKKDANPQKAMMVMKETSESIDKVCEKHGTTLSEWKKTLSESDLQKYEKTTADFLNECKKIK